MDANPYDSPSLTASDVETGPADVPLTRPVGVTILAILHGLGGIALGVLLIVIAKASDNEEWFDQKGLTFAAFAVIGTICALLALASGIGMWLGTKWSWWLAAFYYFSMLFGDGCQLLMIIPIKATSLGLDAVEELLIKHAVKGIINFLLLYYLFKANVLRFFGLGSMRKVRAVGVLLGVTLVFLVAVSTLVIVHLINRRG